MGRILHEHACTPSVVIEETGVESVAVLEVENDSPIPADGHGPEALQAAFERVQSKSGNVERGEKTLDFAAQRRVDPARIATFVEPFEATMPKAPDHNGVYSDNCR